MKGRLGGSSCRGDSVREDGGSLCLMLVGLCLRGWKREGVMGGAQALETEEGVKSGCF